MRGAVADASLLPLVFTVTGRPYSHQSRSRAKVRVWQQTVRAAAAALWSGPPIADRPLQIKVVYYHVEGEAGPDGDNLLKPIQDALNGLVYADDALVVDCQVRRTRINGRFQVLRMHPTTAAAFVRGEPFVQVIVEDAPDHGELLRERT